MEKNNCENCKNKTICKYYGDFKSVEEAVSGIKLDSWSPILIKIECTRYEKIPQKQDGFYIHK